jgi:hypothetical protein
MGEDFDNVAKKYQMGRLQKPISVISGANEVEALSPSGY